jgi:hypothetical protein
VAVTTGNYNTALGYQAGDSLTSGVSNVLLGRGTGATMTEADEMVLIGNDAGASINHATAADGTVAVGYAALAALTSGAGNLAIGYQAMLTHTEGSRNMAIGYGAMDDTDATAAADGGAGGTPGTLASVDNIFIGYDSGGGTWAGSDSNFNIAIGNYSMDAAMDGALNNTAVGYNALSGITTGQSNTAIGKNAGDDITVGVSNVNIGSGAGHYMVDSTHSVVIGAGAGSSAVNYIGDYCILIGSSADVSTGAAQNQIVIGYDATGVANNTAMIGNASCADVYMGDDGNAWSQVSDERLKRNIEDWDVGLDAINKLRIRQFQFKDDNPFGFTSDKVRQGVVAQEAIEALPEMIRTNEEGWMSANNESMVWAMVNAIQELSAEVESLKEQLKA